MCGKLHPLISLLALLVMITSASAATQYNIWMVTGNQDWFAATNWSKGAVPYIAADYLTSGNVGVTTYNSSSAANGPIIAGDDARLIEMKIGGANGLINTGTVTMNSGTLSTENFIMVGPDGTISGGKNGAFFMNGGTVTVGGAASGTRTNGDLFIGNGFAGCSGVTGTLTMTAGTIDVGGTLTVVRNAGALGYIYLNGGTIQTHAISMQAGAHFDISGGTLIIDGNVTGTIDTYKTNGWMTAYGQSSGVQHIYDSGTDKTTVTGVTGGITRAANPNPGSGSTGIMLNPTLSWEAGLNTLSYNVYFGTASPGTLQSDPNSADTNFTPAGPLAANTTYFWRVDSIGETNTVEGFVWTFTTGSPKASIPNPANAATQVTITPTLTWAAGAGAVSHDVYLGTTNPPTTFVNITEASYTPATLATDMTYYWRVNERDGFSGVATGDVWSFSTASAVRKGPYLIYPGINTQMTILWQLPSTQSCTLAWGTDTNYSTGSTATAEYGADHQHKYTITGLAPGTKYYYRINTSSSTLTGSFRCAPATDANNVKFVVYGDTRANPDKQNTLLTQVNSMIAADPALQTILMHSGDWVERADEDHWASEFFNRSYTSTLQMQTNMPIIGGLGNHEINGDGISVFDKYWPYTYAQPANGRYYSFDYGPVHIAVVDMETALYIAGSAQLQWLASDLAAASAKKWKIVMFHEPGWSATGATNTHSNNSTVQTDIEPILEQYGVQVVFAGHNHYYSRAVVNGVHHVTSGGGGAPFYGVTAGDPCVVTYTGNTLEFCKVEVTDNTLGVSVITDQGQVIDSFWVDKSEPEFTFVQVTDPQIGWSQCGNMDFMWEKAVGKINVVNPALAVVTGDLVDNRGNSSAIALYKAYAAELKPTIPLYQLPGNHDIGDTPDTTSYTLWQNNFSSSGTSNPWFSFSYGDTLFICLDSMVLKNPTNLPTKATEQMNWLTTTLQNSGGYAHKLVFMHISLCLVSTTEADQTFNMPLGTGNGVRKQLLDLFHQYGVNAVFSGHAHYNSYLRDGDLEIITTSSSNCSLGSPSTCQGFRIIEIYPDHIEHYYRCLDSITTLPCDFNGDGICDEKDFGVFVGHWLDNGIWP